MYLSFTFFFLKKKYIYILILLFLGEREILFVKNSTCKWTISEWEKNAYQGNNISSGKS